MTPQEVGEQHPEKAWHRLSAEEVLAHLNSAPTGLSAAEAATRLASNGPNELKKASPSARGRFFSINSKASSSGFSSLPACFPA